MKKSEAIEILGGSIASAAKAIGVSYQAVAKWPDELSPRIVDRVIAAQVRTKYKSKPVRVDKVRCHV